METQEYTAANRRGWDEVAPLHEQQNMSRLLNVFKKPGHSCLDPIETACLNEIGISGAAVAQVCCNNGQELLSVKNLGAGFCVGFDGSEPFIAQARALNQAAGQDCQFVCTDAYEIPNAFHARFDLALITIGVLSWMPDLPRFLQVCANLLLSGGHLFIYEQHPILDMFEPGASDKPVSFDHSYFKADPFVEKDGLDYYGRGQYAGEIMYSFHHKLSDIFSAGLAAGLQITHFQEHPGHISHCWYNVEKAGFGLPMSYTLVLHRPAR